MSTNIEIVQSLAYILQIVVILVILGVMFMMFMMYGIAIVGLYNHVAHRLFPKKKIILTKEEIYKKCKEYNESAYCQNKKTDVQLRNYAKKIFEEQK